MKAEVILGASGCPLCSAACRQDIERDKLSVHLSLLKDTLMKQHQM
jgi:hypothetical protein